MEDSERSLLPRCYRRHRRGNSLANTNHSSLGEPTCEDSDKHSGLRIPRRPQIELNSLCRLLPYGEGRRRRVMDGEAGGRVRDRG